MKTTFNFLKSRFIRQRKKNYFEDWVSKIQFKIEYFCCLPDPKKCLEYSLLVTRKLLATSSFFILDPLTQEQE